MTFPGFSMFVVFLRWLTGEMGQNLILPLNVIIIFLHISSFQNGLNDLSIPCGCLFMVDNVSGGISKCRGKTKENKGVQTFKTPQKTETAISIYIYSSLAKVLFV